MEAELRNRLLFGPALALTVLAAFVGDFLLGCHYLIGAVILVGVPLACREFAALLARRGIPVNRPVLYLGSSLVAVLPLVEPSLASSVPWWPRNLSLLPWLLVVGLLVTAGCRMARRGIDGFLGTVGATCAGMLYLGLLPSFLLMLTTGTWETWNAFPMRGELLLLLTLTSCKLGDVCAFTCGKLIGRHKLAPSISPGKTWEGFGGSVAGAVGGAYLATAVAVWWGAPLPFTGWWAPAIWGGVVAPLGVLGDLVESVFKRECGVKDSGTGLPGFGGFLDVFDAVLLVAPVTYALAFVF